MNSIKNYVMSFVIALSLIQLCLVIYGGLQTDYGVTRDSGQETNLFEKIVQLNIVAGPLQIGEGVMKLLNANIFNPLDLIGGLATAGIGTLRALGGIVTLPAEIIGVIGGFYYIPEAVAALVGVSIIVTIGILLLQLYIKPFQPL